MDYIDLKRPRLLVADAETGHIYEHPYLEAALDNGVDYLRASAKDFTTLPFDWDLMMMPDTQAVGFNPQSGAFEVVASLSIKDPNGEDEIIKTCAVAMHPPPGYVRHYHAAAHYLDMRHPDIKFKEKGGGSLTVFGQDESPEVPLAEDSIGGKSNGGDDSARPGLPLWAYTAVGLNKNGDYVASLFVGDETTRWSPDLYYQKDLKEKIAQRIEQSPDNAILNQLSDCAGNYLCCCAQNIFYERWEGAVPCAPACTARCLGCLSKDPEWDTPTPQKRLKFSPKAKDIAEVMIHHLERAPEGMVSFGQGCEGEPTMYGDVMVESIEMTRAQTDKGIINVNTNGSRPEVIRRAAEAGLGALRVSVNTFDEAVYDLYYRPQDYTFADVMRSLEVGQEMGLYNSINFLIWPGWTDRMEELERVSELVSKGLIQMIQLRNLCVDPGHYRAVLPPKEKRGLVIGMRAFVEELHRRHPKLRFGTFNPRLNTDWYDAVPSWVKTESQRMKPLSA